MCLGIPDCMLDILDFILLGAGFCHILLLLDFVLGSELTYFKSF